MRGQPPADPRKGDAPTGSAVDAAPRTPDPEGEHHTASRARINWRVFIASGLAIVAVAAWAIIIPENADSVINAAVAWVSANFGWYYILTATLMVVFVLVIALSKSGEIRLGPDHSRPTYNLFTWTSMLFAAGIGIDLMFFSVSEPVTQYLAPPAGAGETVEAARQGIVWTLFHYGVTGWAMYALMGMAFGYFAYRRNMPLSIRTLLQPLLGRRIQGWLGDTVDVAAVLGTVFGIATSLGIGVVQLNYGLYLMFGIPQGTGAQIGLIVFAVALATLSTMSGVEKGIRRLSELNVLLAIVLLGYVLIAGKTRFLLDALVMNIGDFIARFPEMTLNTFAWEQPDEWMSAWTLFFWAWWIAWAPFVSLFLARISRGRTIRQFVAGVLIVPLAFIVIFISIFGNSALDFVRAGNTEFGDIAMNVPEQGFYDLLSLYPGTLFVIGLATVVGILFYVTSADSGALVLSNFTSIIDDPREDGAKSVRIFWSVATGVLTMAMLIVGGVTTLQAATVIIGLPFSIVLYLVMISLWKALRVEGHQREGRLAAFPAGLASGGALSWRQRLARMTALPSASQAQRFQSSVVEPALSAVHTEIVAKGFEALITQSTVASMKVDEVSLCVRFDGEQQFDYQVYPVPRRAPGVGGYGGRGEDVFRLEVFSAAGSQGYDVYGFTPEQLIADVLTRFESHLEFVRIASDEGGTLPAVGAAAETPDWQADF
ncbi:choline BCCT transporter BetT [Brevibacterium yomogidense]|uniref:choline BCCT transporter BetT n=1 Tax=Brevibacterium yomogidense TaxID=946573 RepID=UPI0018DFF046|nr:choline BCCT transporter BetT [Brevibacterium yomogidense]